MNTDYVNGYIMTNNFDMDMQIPHHNVAYVLNVPRVFLNMDIL